MSTIYKRTGNEWVTKPGGFALSLLLLTLLSMGISTANAQRSTQSDWSVPPPLTPGTITRGNIDGRPGSTGTAVLRFTDVPAGVLQVSAGGVPDLPPISATPPEATQPEQPEPVEVLAALPAIPVPEVPGLPDMPERTVEDAPEPPVNDLPMPTTPDVPPIPEEPIRTTAPNAPTTGLLPLMPEVNPPATFAAPPAGTMIWTTPGVAPVTDFKLIMRTN